MKKLLFLLLLPFSILAHQYTITFKVAPDHAIRAFADGQPAGYLEFHIVCENPRQIYIDSFKIYPEFRNQKIGTALLQEAINYFEHEHTYEIFLNACPFGPGEKLELLALMNFYRKHGFQDLTHTEANNPNIPWANMHRVSTIHIA